MNEAVAAGAEPALLAVEGIVQQFGGLRALDDVTLSLGDQGIHAVIGPNGAGKTTLFNIITGRQKPTAGRVVFAGEPISGRRSDQISRRGISRTFQNVRVFKQMTVLDNILVGAHRFTDVGPLRGILRIPFRRSRRDAEAQEHAHELARLCGLEGDEGRLAATLPLEAQRKVELARALAARPRLLLLDEPTAGMNTAEKVGMTRLIRQVAERGTKVLLVEHDMRMVMELADRISVLNFGRLIAEGGPAAVRADEQVIEAYLGRRR